MASACALAGLTALMGIHATFPSRYRRRVDDLGRPHRGGERRNRRSRGAATARHTVHRPAGRRRAAAAEQAGEAAREAVRLKAEVTAPDRDPRRIRGVLGNLTMAVAAAAPLAEIVKDTTDLVTSLLH